MADKSVGELVAAKSVTPTDLFVLEQNGTAKKLTGQILENWLVSFADGHGGIHSIEKVSTSGLVDTYRIALADTTTFDFVVTNGRSVKSIVKTATSGLVDTYTISYNDGTTEKITVTNGAKGDKGDNAYIWVKYASQEPTEASHSFGDIPDTWIGLYIGTASTAPTDWQDYTWYQWKGEKGDTGEPAKRLSVVHAYQVGDTGNAIPSGTWQATIPNVPQGKFLWIRKTTTWNSGDPDVDYSISRMGLDGSGSVSSVADISPDENGNVPLTAEDIGALPNTGGDMAGAINMNGQKIKGLNAPTADDEPATKGYTASQITDRVIYGKGKNLLKRTITGYNSVGIVATVNPDGIITLNGTSTNSTRVPCGTAHLEGGKTYVINGRPTGGEVDDYRADLRDSTGSTILATDAGAGATYTPQADMDVLYIIRVGAGAVFTGQTFYPMIRLATETDDTYEPYYEGLKDAVSKSQVVNNFTTTEEGFVADARALKVLNDNLNSASFISKHIIHVDNSGSSSVKNVKLRTGSCTFFVFAGGGAVFYATISWNSNISALALTKSGDLHGSSGFAVSYSNNVITFAVPAWTTCIIMATNPVTPEN